MRTNRFIALLTGACLAVLAFGQMARADIFISVNKSTQRMTVTVNGRTYDVEISDGAPHIAPVQRTGSDRREREPADRRAAAGQTVSAPLAGTILRILASPGQQVDSGQVLMVLEAMKMEVEVRAPASGTVSQLAVKEGEAVEVGRALIQLS